MINDLLGFTRARLGGCCLVNHARQSMYGALRQVVEELEAVHPQRYSELNLSGNGSGDWGAISCRNRC